MPSGPVREWGMWLAGREATDAHAAATGQTKERTAGGAITRLRDHITRCVHLFFPESPFCCRNWLDPFVSNTRTLHILASFSLPAPIKHSLFLERDKKQMAPSFPAILAILLNDAKS